ncbi:hypothetical protein SPIROBIBN47_50080 [uncultured spirochete]|uniref:Uncharacterized protein n=1 Tax=uncultured spirochete TaxID=156406 RepID=A0A3P3XLP6_9SPIR|nr:hypothetical protein SPIROBIBN47_50080 [uncultured spirochete]
MLEASSQRSTPWCIIIEKNSFKSCPDSVIRFAIDPFVMHGVMNVHATSPLDSFALPQRFVS